MVPLSEGRGVREGTEFVSMATFYFLQENDLEQLKNHDPGGKKRAIFTRKKKPAELFAEKLESIAHETIKYKWADLSLSILAVFSKEKLQADWHDLEHNVLANELTEKYETGVYIFSSNDIGLIKLKPNNYFYRMNELDQFAVTFQGTKPNNPNLMRNAAKFLDEILSSLKAGIVAVLVME